MAVEILVDGRWDSHGWRVGMLGVGRLLDWLDARER
jgi:hypothetical protein